MLYPVKSFENYYPYEKQQNQKCVSLVNGTGAARSDFAAFDGKKVVVIGFAIRYADLQLGTAPADRIMSKRYFKDEVVLNSCLRELIFVVSSVQPQ